MVKLSKTQLEVLNILRSRNTHLCYKRYMGTFNPYPYWSYALGHERVRCSTVKKLVKCGYLQIEYSDGYPHTSHLVADTKIEWYDKVWNPI